MPKTSREESRGVYVDSFPNRDKSGRIEYRVYDGRVHTMASILPQTGYIWVGEAENEEAHNIWVWGPIFKPQAHKISDPVEQWIRIPQTASLEDTTHKVYFPDRDLRQHFLKIFGDLSPSNLRWVTRDFMRSPAYKAYRQSQSKRLLVHFVQLKCLLPVYLRQRGETQARR